jgi:hypothetical protein
MGSFHPKEAFVKATCQSLATFLALSLASCLVPTLAHGNPQGRQDTPSASSKRPKASRAPKADAFVGVWSCIGQTGFGVKRASGGGFELRWFLAEGVDQGSLSQDGSMKVKAANGSAYTLKLLSPTELDMDDGTGSGNHCTK